MMKIEKQKISVLGKETQKLITALIADSEFRWRTQEVFILILIVILVPLYT